MAEKRRLTRIQWVQGMLSPEAASPEENAVLWNGLAPGDDPSTWGMFPEDDDEEDQRTEKLIQKQDSLAELLPDPTDKLIQAEDGTLEEDTPGMLASQMLVSPVKASMDEQLFSSEGEQRQLLLNALVILAGLWIVCGVVPLFIALFVSLRVFFWLEIAGWIIILGWAVIGVRPPLLAWLKERRQRTGALPEMENPELPPEPLQSRE